MTIFKNNTCFVIGGYSAVAGDISNSVSSHKIIQDYWEPGTPGLKIARMYAAACSLGDFVVVFAGVSKGVIVNSIERINISTKARSVFAWELIELPSQLLACRQSPIVIPLNNNEIAILGGCGGKHDANTKPKWSKNDGYLSDVLVFNMKKRKCL